MRSGYFRQFGWSQPVRDGYWFAQKRYGFGAVPATLAGWVATALYVLAIGLIVKAMHSDEVKLILGGALTVAFLAITWLKTDGGWRWRWGSSDR